MKFKYLVLFVSMIVISNCSEAKNIYVDSNLSQNITNGSYSIANRNASGNDGNAYTTVQSAVNAMDSGDDIFLRGGRYILSATINIPLSKNGTSSNWSSIQSYGDEWAILDGNNNCGDGDPSGAIIGHLSYDKNGSHDLGYWRFERLEFTRARSISGGHSFAIWANGGPLIIRYCSFHDNVATSYGNNPAALTGMTWHDVLIEYNHFDNNGANTTHHNSGHIQPHSDYIPNEIAANGYPGPSHNGHVRNEIRYNLVKNGTTGIKHKGNQLLSARGPYSDTYKDYGDKIHHNIFIGLKESPLRIKQDFCQVYNNIIDNCGGGIVVGYERSMYKVITYNNNVISSYGADDIGGLHRLVIQRYSNEDGYYYGWDINNIVDGIADMWNGSDARIGFSENIVHNYTRYFMKNSYFYRPVKDSRDSNGTLVVSFGSGTTSRLRYNIPDLLSTYPQCSDIWRNDYTSNDLLYQGTSGAARYKVNGSHNLSGSVTISNGGNGGAHPYLPGVSFPTYVGAVDPNDSGWIDDVMSLENLSSGVVIEKDPAPPRWQNPPIRP